MSLAVSKVTVAPTALSGELDRIRRQAAELDSQRDAAQNREAAPRLRATLSNVVLLIDRTADTGSPEALEALIGELCVGHPSRFFIVNYCGADRDGTPPLATAVSSRCVLTDSGVHVCSEEVFVDVYSSRVGVVPNLLLSLFVPDIECVLLQFGNLEQCSSAEAGICKLLWPLAAMSDVVVCDSICFENYPQGIAAVELALQQPAAPGFRGAIARDMTWNRGDRWRELLAEQFDSIQFRGQTWTVKRAALTVANPAGVTGLRKLGEALLIGGWITSRLGWEVQSSAREPVSLRVQCMDAARRKGELVFKAVESKQARCEQHLCSIVLEVEIGGKTVEIKVQRTDDRTSAETSVRTVAGVETGAGQAGSSPGSSDAPVRRVPFSEPPLERLVISSIGTQGMSADFFAAQGCALLIAK